MTDTPKEEKVKIDNTQILADTGLRVIHFNRIDFNDRSMTLAYKGTDRLVEIATAVTHPNDRFCRKIGTKTAVEAFLAGKTVRLPVPREWQGRVSEFLITVFSVV